MCHLMFLSAVSTVLFLSANAGLCAEDAIVWKEVAAFKEILPFKEYSKEGNKMRGRIFTLKESLRKRRLHSIKSLMRILDDESLPNSARMESARMLGHLRASQAVDLLIKHIRLGPLFVSDGANEHPCHDALIRIGKPASKAVLKELHKPMKELRRMALVTVLAGVEGRQVGRFMLQQEIAKAKTPEARHNLQLGLKAFLAMTANERTAEELKNER